MMALAYFSILYLFYRKWLAGCFILSEASSGLPRKWCGAPAPKNKTIIILKI
jgi:hypothetical protein